MNEHLTPEEIERLADPAGGGALPAPRGAHLERCGRCRTGLEEWRALDRWLAALGHVPVPAGFAARVMARVRLPVPWYDRAWSVARAHWGSLAAAAAVLAVVTGAAGYWLFGAQGVAPLELTAFLLGGLRDLAVEGLLAAGRVAYRLGLVDAGSSIADRIGATEALGGLALASTTGLLALWTMLRLMRPAPRLAGTRDARY